MNAYIKKVKETARKRRARMQRLRDQGLTLAEIARREGGISRQRVLAILKGK